MHSFVSVVTQWWTHIVLLGKIIAFLVWWISSNYCVRSVREVRLTVPARLIVQLNFSHRVVVLREQKHQLDFSQCLHIDEEGSSKLSTDRAALLYLCRYIRPSSVTVVHLTADFTEHDLDSDEIEWAHSHRWWWRWRRETKRHLTPPAPPRPAGTSRAGVTQQVYQLSHLAAQTKELLEGKIPNIQTFQRPRTPLLHLLDEYFLHHRAD